MKRCGVSCSGNLLCHFINASEGKIDGENFFDRNVLRVGITIDHCHGNTNEVTTEIENLYYAGKVIHRWRYEKNCFNGGIDELSDKITNS